jgi:Transposase DDE domain group 1
MIEALRTAAYWLMFTLRDAIPKAHALAKAEFATIRLRLIKLGARVIETASRIRLAFAAACPEAALIGRYSVRRLIEKYGRKANMMKWKEQLNGDCLKRDAHSMHERCDLICPDLPKVL